ncbi:terminase large subunit domain-containing protein [Streptomyces drozdowiczii]|uniref:Terminase family protein n=1 Tax=Streptomyces drozdowiczii TaxID=202862 RepID=A0ABY6PPG1_9ACTN|nr:terminase family protein [Streptomyces drozdowiczii]MCX0246422.1 terminase family protein [Streptomyces drozdowiczii]UZK54075.1 terminase family protein [Streptomyces drozdowiczii]
MTFPVEALDRLTPGELEEFVQGAEKVVQDREAGKVPWLCDIPDCDGQPHPGRQGRHSRAAQRPPATAWDVWMALAGRGWGKTRTGAEWVISKARTPGTRGALIGPTAADTRDILVEGESGILACAPATFRPEYQPSKRRLVYPNGSIQTCYSADEPDRLRGPQHHYGWFDELAAWRYLQQAWDMAQLGMRLGEHPQICITTTPRPLPLVKQLLVDPGCATVRGSTYDNLHNLAPSFQRAVVAKYEGTTLGRQELDAEVLEDLPGALVARHLIDAARVRPEDVPELISIVVGLDPAGTSRGDETGLIVAGWGADKHHYVMADASRRRTPDETARAAYALLEQHGAVKVVVEDNGGKDWIENVLQRVWRDLHGDNAGPAPIQRVNAAQGKKLRAQPVAMLYEQGRVHHVGSLPELEDQLTTWIPEEDPNSPDRIDAMVHAVTHHMRRDRRSAALVSPHRAARERRTPAVHPALAARQAAQRRAS